MADDDREDREDGVPAAERIGETRGEFVSDGHVRCSSRPGPAVNRHTAYYRRLKQTTAAALLTKAGWSAADIALALGVKERTVKRKRKLCRLLAEASGRV